MSQKRVIVIGAGIGGIAAAHELNKQGFEVCVFERAGFVGGRMKSITLGEYRIDVGAGLLPGAYVDTKALIHEAGLAHMMEAVNGKCIFLRGNKRFAIDMANMNGGMLTSALLSLRSKLSLLKLMLSLLINYRKLTFQDMGMAADSDTETVSEYCRKRFPSEVCDYLLGPFCRTMYLHPPEEASITELLWCMKNLTGQPFSLKGGMDLLAKTLAAPLDVQLNTEVISLESHASGVKLVVQHQGVQRTEEADFCLIATDAAGLNQLHGPALTTRQQKYLQDLKYCPDIVITFCLSQEPAVDAILIQVPESIDPELAAIVIDHKKGSGRAPPGKGMVTCHFLYPWGERMFWENDETILAAATASVAKIIPEVATHCEAYNIERWPAAATRAQRGTFKSLAGFMADIDHSSRVQYAGDYMALSSVNVAVACAHVAASSIVKAASREET